MICTAKSFPCLAYNGYHTVTTDFETVVATIDAMVSRVIVKLNYLRSSGVRVKSVTITDVKERACEIRGMIALIACVCECQTLVDALLTELQDALATALARLRK